MVNGTYLLSFESGQSFHVFEQGRFAKDVLPLYFKHNNIASFIRQLNMYGFRKVANVEHGGMRLEKDDVEFSHPYFQREHEDLLEHIKRKVATSVKADDVKIKHDDVHKVLTDVHHLRGKQDNINSKFDTLKRENEALWREMANLRQKHLKQQQIVNKLIQFLVTIVGSGRGLGNMKRPARMPLMLHGTGASDQQVRPAKVPRRPEPRRPEPQARTNVQVMPKTFIKPDPDQLASGVQIQEVLSPNMTSQPGTGSVVYLPTTDESQDENQQTFIVVNEPQQVSASEEFQSQLDLAPATSPPPYSGIVTSPQSMTEVLSPASTTEQYIEVNSPYNMDLMSPGTMAELGLTPLDTNNIAGSSFSNDYNSPSDPVLQVTTQSPPNSSSRAVAVSPHHHTVNAVTDDMDTIHESLEGLRGLLGTGAGMNLLEPSGSLFGFPLDHDTLHGLFTPEAPVPPTPEPLLNLGGQDDHHEPDYSKADNADNQLVEYIPNENFDSLFDLDLESVAQFVPELNSLQTESEELSTPVYSMTSPLAERRKSKGSTSTTTTTEEVD